MTMVAAILGARLLAAAVAHAPAVPASIAVEVDAAVVDGEALAARLAAGVEPLAYLLPPTPLPSAEIHVSGELLDFHVSLELPASTPVRTASRCPCTHAELVAHVQRRVALALRPRPACPPAPRVRAPAPRPAPPPVVIERRGPGPAGRLGVVLIGLGGIALGTGTGLLAAVEVADDERWRPRTDLRPPALSAVVAGAGALATGALLLVLDRRLPRARRRSAAPPW